MRKINSAPQGSKQADAAYAEINQFQSFAETAESAEAAKKLNSVATAPSDDYLGSRTTKGSLTHTMSSHKHSSIAGMDSGASPTMIGERRNDLNDLSVIQEDV